MTEDDEGQVMIATETQDRDPSTPLAIARAELASGERLVWADSSLAASARRRVLPLSLLGWLFLLLSLAWMAKAAIASFWLLIMGLPFFLVAVAIAFLPWWWPSMSRHTIYAISDRRLLIIRNWPRRQVTSYGPEDIDVIERMERKDGSGDLIFRREEHRKLRHHHDPQGKRRVGERAIGFFGVSDVRRLEEAVWALKERKSAVPLDSDLQRSGGGDSGTQDARSTMEDVKPTVTRVSAPEEKTP